MAWFTHNRIPGKSKHIDPLNGTLADGRGVVFGTEVDLGTVFTERDPGAVILGATIRNSDTTNDLYWGTSETAVKSATGHRNKLAAGEGQFVNGPVSALTIWAAPGDASTTAYEVTLELAAVAPTVIRDEALTFDNDWITFAETGITWGDLYIP